MNIKWARSTAEKLVEAVESDNKELFWDVLNPVLDSKVPFPYLDEMGKILGTKGKQDHQRYFDEFDEIIEANKMGGYVIVGQALAQLLETQLKPSIYKAKEAVIKGKTWYVCDIIGERVFGQALVDHFEPAFRVIQKMTSTQEQEVKRSIGVGVHFFAKRRPKDVDRMKHLLSMLTVMVEDKRVFVVKGVGWGLKTIGRHQPKLIEDYVQNVLKTKNVSKLMLRKATKYLDDETKQKLLG